MILSYLHTFQAMGFSDPCIMSKILDEYEKSEVRNSEVEEDNKALGVLVFTGQFSL